MDSDTLFSELENICASLGIELKREPCPGGGGMYELRGKRCMVVSPGLSKTEAAWLVASELSRLDLEAVFLKPAVRDLLDRAKSERIRPQ